jgi:hypothetical protein
MNEELKYPFVCNVIKFVLLEEIIHCILKLQSCIGGQKHLDINYKQHIRKWLFVKEMQCHGYKTKIVESLL